MKGSTAIVEEINKIRALFPLVVFTRDWHPANHVSFAETHGMAVGEKLEVWGIWEVILHSHR